MLATRPGEQVGDEGVARLVGGGSDGTDPVGERPAEPGEDEGAEHDADQQLGRVHRCGRGGGHGAGAYESAGSSGRRLRYPSKLHSGEWRNWQTRWLQVPVSVRTWGFKSPLAHHSSGCNPPVIGFEVDDGSMHDPRTSPALRTLAELTDEPPPRRWAWSVGRLDAAGRLCLGRPVVAALGTRAVAHRWHHLALLVEPGPTG